MSCPTVTVARPPGAVPIESSDHVFENILVRLDRPGAKCDPIHFLNAVCGQLIITRGLISSLALDLPTQESYRMYRSQDNLNLFIQYSAIPLLS